MGIPDVKLKSNGAYWQAYWDDGKREVRSLGPKSKLSRRQANVRCRELAVRLLNGDPSLRRQITPRLSEWLERYKALRTDHSEATQYLNDAARTYLERYFDNDPTIDRITRADAADWRRALSAGELSIDNPNATRAPGETTVCKHVRTVKRIFREAEDQEIILANPFSRLRSTAPKAVREWKVVTRVELERILEACPGPGWRCLFALCRFAGLRRGEALRIRWGDILWDKNRMVVNATIRQETTKKAVRTVPIELAKCKTGLMRILREAFEAARAGAELVCEGVQVSSIDNKAVAILALAGFDYSKPFHTLRKCCETDWAQQYPQHAVSEWIGHDITVSASHYLKVPEELYRAPRAQAQSVPSRKGKQHKPRTRTVQGK